MPMQGRPLQGRERRAKERAKGGCPESEEGAQQCAPQSRTPTEFRPPNFGLTFRPHHRRRCHPFHPFRRFIVDNVG